MLLELNPPVVMRDTVCVVRRSYPHPLQHHCSTILCRLNELLRLLDILLDLLLLLLLLLLSLFYVPGILVQNVQ